MPFVPAPGIIQLEMIYNINSQVVENVFHYRFDGEMSVTALQDLTDIMFTKWGTTFKTIMTPYVELDRIKATDLTTAESPSYEIAPASGNAGNHEGEVLPLNCSICIGLLTPDRGRSNRGRFYVPGISQDLVLGDDVDNGTIATLTSWFSVYGSFLGTDYYYTQVVLSKYHDHAPRLEAHVSTVTSWRVNPVIASQRRRLPGRGR